MRRAAARGVQVELLCADWAARRATIGSLQALARVPDVEVRMIAIPAWSGGFISFARVAHAKLLVVDGSRGWLGTSNWERDYFYKSRNVAVLVDDAAVVGQLDEFFTDAWDHATRVDPDATYTPPRRGSIYPPHRQAAVLRAPAKPGLSTTAAARSQRPVVSGPAAAASPRRVPSPRSATSAVPGAAACRGRAARARAPAAC